MKHSEKLTGIGASIGILILILDGKTALAGAQEGIELCLKTVIPSLFPFFVLSILITSIFSGTSVALLNPVRRLCKLPEGTEAILLSGFLGGYPVGAQCISQAYHKGSLTKQDAERMLAFSNNAGPAFLFGMVAAMFSQRRAAWILWGIHVISAIMTARLFPISKKPDPLPKQANITATQALQSAIHVMAMVCGWVILFRVILTFLKRWIFWIFPITLQVVLTGILELSNGCCELLLIDDESARFIICSGILAFGGLCVSMQTMAVTNGLSLKFYFTGKLLQTVFSLILSWAVTSGVWQYTLILMLFFLLVHGKAQKKCSIRVPIGV